LSFSSHQWGLILGGSSGFGLATAHRLSAHGMNLAIVHRDRRGAMKRIEPEFSAMRQRGVGVVTFNADALAAGERERIIGELKTQLGEAGRFRLVLHSIALGNLKPLVPYGAAQRRTELIGKLSAATGVDRDALTRSLKEVAAQGFDELVPLVADCDYGTNVIDEEDLAGTIYSMGTSLFSWVRALLDADLFDTDARVLGLTSEGNEVAWRGYSAISAAKVAMESLSRSMALELAPLGIRSNIVQAGITETPASAMIPGIEGMKAAARKRNPFGRLTCPEDVAGVIYLLCRDEASWINGTILRVDGGEHISGGNC
jgi:NAD(P)-dependent dehydrogenase (short-subunit alcohol dehydrogenase family)